MDYKIIYGTLDEIENQMREFIGEGWEPSGGIAVVNGSIYQAIIKRWK